MAVVLDTCAWLWFCSNHKKLSKAAADAIRREQRRAGLIVSVFSRMGDRQARREEKVGVWHPLP